jgi:EF hand
MKTMTTALAACILSLHATAGAQQPAEDEESEGIPATPHQEQAAREIASDRFKQLDVDRDGSISEDEARADPSLSGSWNDLDGNGDGSLDMEEFSASAAETSAAGATKADMPATRHQEHAVQGGLMKELDEDGDGAISQQEAEAEAQLSDNWDQLDRNADGKLDSRELDRFDQ